MGATRRTWSSFLWTRGTVSHYCLSKFLTVPLKIMSYFSLYQFSPVLRLLCTTILFSNSDLPIRKYFDLGEFSPLSSLYYMYYAPLPRRVQLFQFFLNEDVINTVRTVNFYVLKGKELFFLQLFRTVFGKKSIFCKIGRI